MKHNLSDFYLVLYSRSIYFIDFVHFYWMILQCNIFRSVEHLRDDEGTKRDIVSYMKKSPPPAY
jgi:hypothetical protein